ncbi:MAG TPA: hypothetical protein VMR19_00175 [Candidatus Saccharimonadales bacterium]|jgi:hypothetical protein|nr:hypothetical protein [Candidatus Saccharimonadales bacterium]
MFPTQTSLIPIGVALARFLGERGLTAFSSNYPYWYLGTTPFRFLTGPVVPILNVLIRKVTGASYFDIMTILVLVSCLISALGWALLTAKIKEEKLNSSSFIVYFLLFVVLPYKYLNGLALAEPSAFIAGTLIPFVLLANRKNSYWGALGVAAVLLVSTNVLPVLLTGLIILSLTGAHVGTKLKKWKKPLKKTLIIFGIGFILATFYYTPAFWLTILVNPSIGGAPGAKAILSLLGMARNMIPVLLALIVIYFSEKIKDRINFFGWTWILVFSFLTFWRALGNINFWMDWTSWFSEIEIGIGILIAADFKNLRRLYLLTLPFLASLFIFRALGSPVLITNSPPLETETTAKLAETAGEKLVFTSGTGVFWLNAFYNTPQVRGGRDEVSTNSKWLPISYTLRESTDVNAISKGLNDLNIRYVLVNSEDSPDYYHDFKNIYLWDGIGKAVWQGSGDTIYSN